MELFNSKRPAVLAVLVLFAGAALAAPTPPAIPATNPSVPTDIPTIPGVNPATPGSVPTVPATNPGAPSTTITFVKGTRGAPSWYSVKKGGKVRVSFKVQDGSTLIKNPKLVSKTVTAVDCNTGSPVATPTYQYQGTQVRFVRGSFVMEWKTPSKAASGACVSLNINSGSSASVWAKLK